MTRFDDKSNGTGTLCARLSTDASAVQGVKILSSFHKLILTAFDFEYRRQANESELCFHLFLHWCLALVNLSCPLNILNFMFYFILFRYRYVL